MTAPYVKDSATSKAAAKSINQADWKRVLDYILSRGTDGATDYEIERDLGLKHQTASARRRGLEQKGHVTLTGNKRKTDSGRLAGVYVHKNFYARDIDTSSEKYKLECLARHLLDNHSKRSGLDWMRKYEVRHGREARNILNHELDMERNRRDTEGKKSLYV